MPGADKVATGAQQDGDLHRVRFTTAGTRPHRKCKQLIRYYDLDSAKGETATLSGISKRVIRHISRPARSADFQVLSVAIAINLSGDSRFPARWKDVTRTSQSL